MIDREIGSAVLFRKKRKQPALLSQLFGQAAAKFIFVCVLARRPRRRPAQVLVAFELFGHPSGDLFSKIHYVRWIGANVKIHSSLLFFPGLESRSRVSSSLNPRHDTLDSKLNSYHSTRSQFFHCVDVVAQVRQNLFRVFAQERRRAKKFRRCVRQVDRAADQIAHAHLRMADLFRNPEMFDLRVVKDFSNRVDWRIRDLVGIETSQPIFARFCAELSAQHIHDLFMPVGAMFVRCKARITDQTIELAGSQEIFPSLVMGGKMNHEGFAVAIEQTVNASFGKIFPRYGFAAVQDNPRHGTR